jgi:hypothetical protein
MYQPVEKRSTVTLLIESRCLAGFAQIGDFNINIAWNPAGEHRLHSPESDFQ